MTQYEKAIIFDTLMESAYWVDVSGHTGYFELRLWGTRGSTALDNAVKFHNDETERKKQDDNN